MHTHVAGSAQSTRSPERTKAYILITAWATRILAFLSIAIQIMAFVTVGDIVFGQFLMVTAILSCMSPLNFKCCFYRDCSRNTKTEKGLQFTYAEVETIGVKNDSVDASVQSAMAETYGQPAIPQTNAEANPIV
ncbi:uncharacterized protein LOC128224910 isoform X3 [Mya arenaria]|uniref:uncharacterized protein LOC128224910 isoform X3 n=1 Tax=Mya arenaria TaxID=6604 RepID=UPI0022E20ACE|nr:uncharacterized protein LOC128224910 isoform X3 [Mya arenaria]